MPVITIKNLPDGVYQRLKKLASDNQRSLNRQAIMAIEKAVSNAEPLDSEAFLADIKKLHKSLRGVYLTDKELKTAIKSGRP